MNISALCRILPVQLFFLLVCILALYATAEEQSSTCSDVQMAEMPCRCCKMQCWSSIARGATHELGHIPGEAGENEALATLKLIRACMISECANVCTQKTPFRPGALAALLEARKRLQNNN